LYGVYFCTLCPSLGPKERSRQALDRLPLVSNVLTNFWMQHFGGARLSPNSVRNAIWHALNEPVCQHLRTRNPRCSTVYIDNSLGPLARDSPCILGTRWRSWLRHCATSRKVAVSIPDCVIGIFHLHYPSGRFMVLELTQPQTEMNTRNIFWG